MTKEEELLQLILDELKQSRKEMQALTKSINRLVDSIEVTVE